jgi:hypothetical protein
MARTRKGEVVSGTPGFWLIVALVAVTIVAPSLIWLADRIADAYDALTARRAGQLEEDAATFGEPTREEVEREW